MNKLADSLDKIKTTNKLKEELDKEKHEQYKEKNILSKSSDITDTTNEMLLKKKLILPSYRDALYDTEKVVESNRIAFNANGESKNVINFTKYDNLIHQILTDLKFGMIPKQSYIIGAPNGFGKTSFVVHAMKHMQEHNMMIVPYISLSELAELKLEKDKEIADGLRIARRKAVEDGKSSRDITRFSDLDEYNSYIELAETEKKPVTIIGRYSWSEYMNSSILFCFLTSIQSKLIESYILKEILLIRASKGLPTIVFTETSIKPYTQDVILSEQVWQDILYSNMLNVSTPRLDRLKHVSCFRGTLG